MNNRGKYISEMAAHTDHERIPVPLSSYARSLGLAARQNTPAIDGAFYVQMVHHINSSPVFIHNRRNRSRRPALGGREKSSTRQSRVYVRFLPFVSGRVHLGRLNTYSIYFRCSLEPRETSAAPPMFSSDGLSEPASISDATIQMDHNAVVLFTIDRLARSDDGVRVTERPQTREL